MPVNNRTEAISAANTQIVPTIEATELRIFLNDSFINSVTFDKDVIGSETPAGGAVTINFGTKDLATVTTAVNLAVSFTNLQNGSVKYLAITKQDLNAITFVGAVDVSIRKNYINSIVTVVIYSISNKNGTICVESINIDNNTNQLNTKVIEIGGWGMYGSPSPTLAPAHGVTSSKIRSVSVIIRDDTNTYSYDLLTKANNM